ncbi:ATP-binding protein [Streptomyces sp. V3I7]|uniref:ATP-binding protein n=1 Tax=Streptomyces sp. V3I7 TaxID=3042278 RepID=UPI00278B97F4|nr:ATP-binding protein [Streptomyces sp. V3I7]MDQ0994360.1 hypothetical protein [Streptomyces sp. V3I7]
MAMPEEPPTRDRSVRYELPGGHGVIALCRTLTRKALREWFGPAGEPGRKAADDAVLLVSEVVTNACTHGGVPSGLRLTGTERALWVEVSDTSPAAPRPPARHRVTRSSGHGLYLVQRLAARWGCVPGGHEGKTVWFEVDIVPGPGAAAGTSQRA